MTTEVGLEDHPRWEDGAARGSEFGYSKDVERNDGVAKGGFST